MLLRGFGPTPMSIYGSDFTGIYKSTFFKMVRRNANGDSIWGGYMQPIYIMWSHPKVWFY